MFEFEWNQFIAEQRRSHRGEMWTYSHDELIYVNDQLIGSYIDFFNWAVNNHGFEDGVAPTLYSVLTKEDYRNQLLEKNHTFIYMYVSIGQTPQSHFLIELFDDILPKTCENFKRICLGFVNGVNRLLTYQDTIFHRIVPGGWIQGGDIIKGNGSDGESIYGKEFEDENFAIPHNNRGILGMANHGRHTNNSQFYITLTATPWMNCRYVAFGQLLEGTELLNQIEEEETMNEHPCNSIVITKCELFDFEETPEYSVPDFPAPCKETEESQEEIGETEEESENEDDEEETGEEETEEEETSGQEHSNEDDQNETVESETQ